MELNTDKNTDKKQIRKKYRELRYSMTLEETRRSSELICRRITEHPAFQEATAVLCYMAFRNEVNCNIIMSTAWESGKHVFLPRMEEGRMEFYLFRADDRLIPNEMGISEPDPVPETFSRLLEQEKKVLVVMPGVVFDRSCQRLGYGGGDYDRYFEDYRSKDPRFTFIGAAYQIQISDERLPREVTDIQPDLIITESEIISTKKKEV